MTARKSLFFWIPPPAILVASFAIWHQYYRTGDEAPPEKEETTSPKTELVQSEKPEVGESKTPLVTAPPTIAVPSPEAKTEVAGNEAPKLTLAIANKLVAEIARRALRSPELEDWLREEDILQRFVAAVDSMANGASPQDQLGFLRPKTGYQAKRSAGGWIPSDRNSLRYKAALSAFSSLDAEVAAAGFKQLEPVLDELYRDLGYPDGHFRNALAKAANLLIATPLQESPQLQRVGSIYVYKDKSLEKLSPAQKQLLRLGAKDAHTVQVKLFEIAKALGFTQ